MQVSIVHLVFLVIGLLSGGIVAWLMFKSRLALADGKGHAAGEVERTSLAEQLKAALQETAGLRTRLANAETHVQNRQIELDKAIRECAQLAERTARLAVVEAAQTEMGKAANRLKNEVSDWREATVV